MTHSLNAENLTYFHFFSSHEQHFYVNSWKSHLSVFVFIYLK